MKSQDIDKLLEELIASDPSMRDRISELRPILESIMSSKPDIRIDEAFFNTLRDRLSKKSQTTSMTKKQGASTPSTSFSFIKLTYVFGGVATIALIALVAYRGGLLSNFSGSSKSVSMAEDSGDRDFQMVSIRRIQEDSAFGGILLDSAERLTTPSGAGGMATANELVAKQSSAIAPIATEDMAVSDDSMFGQDRMIVLPYEQTIVKYVYRGDSISLSDERLDVYRRSNGSFSSSQLSALVGRMQIGVMSVSSFEDLNVSDISLYQERPYGYQIYISPRNGVVSINENWEQWKDAYPVCMDGNCPDRSLTASDVPSDEELFGIADAFLKEHRIDMSSYGSPEVNRDWEMYAMTDSKMAYVPDSISVTYPLLVEGEPVYQNGSGKVGMNVQINIRVNKVSNVYGIQMISLEASSYPAITDSQDVIDMAENGGISSPNRYPYPSDTEMRTVEATLGTPTRGLTQIFQYKDGQSIELYVPALFFPVTKKPDTNDVWVPDMIIVPIIEGIESDAPQIMPLMRTGGGVSGSSGALEATATEPAIAPMVDTEVDLGGVEMR